jgi:hypothetical protein
MCTGADRRLTGPASGPLAASGHYARRWFASVFDRTATASYTATIPALMVT